jgi:hypothetical protein
MSSSNRCGDSKELQRLDGPFGQAPPDPLHHAAHEEQRNENQQQRLRMQPSDGFFNVVIEEFHSFQEKQAPRPVERGAL